MTRIGGGYRPPYEHVPAGYVPPEKKTESKSPAEEEDSAVGEIDAGSQSGMSDERGRERGQGYEGSGRGYKSRKDPGTGDIIDELV